MLKNINKTKTGEHNEEVSVRTVLDHVTIETSRPNEKNVTKQVVLTEEQAKWTLFRLAECLQVEVIFSKTASKPFTYFVLDGQEQEC